MLARHALILQNAQKIVLVYDKTESIVLFNSELARERRLGTISFGCKAGFRPLPEVFERAHPEGAKGKIMGS